MSSRIHARFNGCNIIHPRQGIADLLLGLIKIEIASAVAARPGVIGKIGQHNGAPACELPPFYVGNFQQQMLPKNLPGMWVDQIEIRQVFLAQICADSATAFFMPNNLILLIGFARSHADARRFIVSRSKRRKSSWLPAALPINSTRKPRVGDPVMAFSPSGDPRIKSTSLKSAFFVLSQIPIGPLLLSDFVTVAPLTPKQCSALQKTLGVPLTKTACEEIDSALHRMVATIALAARIPGWGAFRERLGAIIESGQTCIKAAQQFEQMTRTQPPLKDKPKGALSVDQAVKKYLALAVIKDSILNINIDAILETCQTAIKEVEPRASKSGPKQNIALDHFLHTVELAAQLSGGPITLPSNAIRERDALPYTTPLFRFGRECLKIAITNGKSAITAASLTDDERSRADEIFSKLGKYITGSKKSDGAFLSRWLKARADFTKNGGSN
jgi:hypothetical protein